jgi:hypothetical protein
MGRILVFEIIQKGSTSARFKKERLMRKKNNIWRLPTEKQLQKAFDRNRKRKSK